MCAQFILKAQSKDLALQLGLNEQQLEQWIEQSSGGFDSRGFDLRVRGFMKTEKAPVIIARSSENSPSGSDIEIPYQLQEMNFSLCPSWSKEFPYPWSTYNARMERPGKSNVTEFIYQVPTWRNAFSRGQTCLVPMSAAIESSYFGSHAGHMIQFSRLRDEVFFCVGIWDQWLDKATGEVKQSFALITDDPEDFFFKAGHDRSVFILPQSQFDDWLCSGKMKDRERFDFLRQHRSTLDWKVESERPMAKGWERRAPSGKEIDQIKIWTVV